VDKLTKINSDELYKKLKEEITENIASRNDLITFSFNGEEVVLKKIF
jgi:hypothetical protein